MSRLQQIISQQQQGGLRCHDCNKRLNRKTIDYRTFNYPEGTTELVPVCKNCKKLYSRNQTVTVPKVIVDTQMR